MTVFGGMTNPETNAFMHNATLSDSIVNYSCGVILILTILVSLPLNSVIFYANSKQKSSVSTMFQILSLSDIFLTVCRTPYSAYCLLKFTQDDLWVRNPSFFRYLASGVGWVSAYCSTSTVLAIAIVRYAKIGYPLQSIRYNRIMNIAVAFLICLTVLWAIFFEVIDKFLIDPGAAWFSVTQTIISIHSVSETMFAAVYRNSKYVYFMILLALSIIFTIATVIQVLLNTDNMTGLVKRSMTTIVLLIIGNCVWLILIIVEQSFHINQRDGYFFHYECYYLVFYATVMGPSLLTAYNPLILCLRSNAVKNIIVWSFSSLKSSFTSLRSSS